MNDVLESFLDTFVFNEHGENLFANIIQFILNGFVYIFDILINEFLDVVFRNFDYERVVYTGHFTTDTLFEFANHGLSSIVADNFFYFVIGLLALVFVFKLFFKLFVELISTFINAILSL
ncbi:MAG: hypothetical protein IKW87_09620 [Ruminococcus sp.]|nr:hypothetical protein [Ruminococcus sp.]